MVYSNSRNYFSILTINMDEEITKQRAIRHPKPRLAAVLAVLVIAIASGAIYINYIRPADSPFSKTIKQSVGFPIYYPSSLPAGYQYAKGSAKIDASLLYYNLSSGNQTIYVTEQAAPQNPPSLSGLPNFKPLNTFAGQAAIGIDHGTPVGIIISNTTLVNLRASNDVPNDVLAKTIQAMSSLPK
jgi:hypothetical protein